MKAVWKNATLADSAETVFLEGNHYFPPGSVNMSYFKDGSQQYTCPWKGKAKYYDVVVEGDPNESSAWSYPEPKEAAKNITGHVAFDRSKGIEVVE